MLSLARRQLPREHNRSHISKEISIQYKCYTNFVVVVLYKLIRKIHVCRPSFLLEFSNTGIFAIIDNSVEMADLRNGGRGSSRWNFVSICSRSGVCLGLMSQKNIEKNTLARKITNAEVRRRVGNKKTAINN